MHRSQPCAPASLRPRVPAGAPSSAAKAALAASSAAPAACSAPLPASSPASSAAPVARVAVPLLSRLPSPSLHKRTVDGRQGLLVSRSAAACALLLPFMVNLTAASHQQEQARPTSHGPQVGSTCKCKPATNLASAAASAAGMGATSEVPGLVPCRRAGQLLLCMPKLLIRFVAS